MNVANVGIVIVSHSPKIAEGAADMVRQMVGKDVPLAWCGGNPAGGLGTSVDAIEEALHTAWSDRGVVVMVDMGGAETNSEMAIERMPEKHRISRTNCSGNCNMRRLCYRKRMHSWKFGFKTAPLTLSGQKQSFAD